MPEPEETRPGAVLTRQQRGYLQGEVDKEGDADRAFRYKIRQRLRAAIHDLALINEYLSTDELRTAFEDGHRPDKPGDDPIPGHAPRENYGFIGHGFEDDLGVPREGDLGSGFPGERSIIEAGLKHLVDSNPAYSKANPSMQRSLRDSISGLCRMAAAAQTKPDRLIEDGYNGYLRDNERESWIAYVTKYSENSAYQEALSILRTPGQSSLNRAHETAIKRRGQTVDGLIDRFD